MLLRTKQDFQNSFKEFCVNTANREITKKSLQKWCQKNKVKMQHVDSFMDVSNSNFYDQRKSGNEPSITHRCTFYEISLIHQWHSLGPNPGYNSKLNGKFKSSDRFFSHSITLLKRRNPEFPKPH